VGSAKFFCSWFAIFMNINYRDWGTQRWAKSSEVRVQSASVLPSQWHLVSEMIEC
jgi:hypothetical protein